MDFINGFVGHLLKEHSIPLAANFAIYYKCEFCQYRTINREDIKMHRNLHKVHNGHGKNLKFSSDEIKYRRKHSSDELEPQTKCLTDSQQDQIECLTDSLQGQTECLTDS